MSNPYASPEPDSHQPAEVPQNDLTSAIRPLRFIFWGGLLCVFDVSFSQTTNGRGFRFDVLNDALGMGLIIYGCKELAKFRVDDRYAKVMTFVLVMSVIEFLLALQEHVISNEPTPPILDFTYNVVILADLIAIALFCQAMRWLCLSANLYAAEQSWKLTFVLFLCIMILPKVLLHLYAILLIIRGSEVNVSLPPALVLLWLFATLIPLIHFFVSTSRMRHSIEGSAL